MGLRCKRCGSERQGDDGLVRGQPRASREGGGLESTALRARGGQVESGRMRGRQRYLCKECGLNFTDTPARGKPLALEAAAVLLYVSGLSMNRPAKLLGVSTPTIQAWLEQFAQAYAQKPEPEGRAVVIELDEMWHYLKKSQSPSGSGKLGIVLQASWWTGSAAVVTRPPASA